jgi:hypothetical protein
MKKLLSILLAAAILCTLFVPVSGTADPSPARNANIFDALDILKNIVGMVALSPVEKYDHNQDGVIDIFDALEVLKGIVGMRAAVQMAVCDCGDCRDCNPLEPLCEELALRIRQDFLRNANKTIEYFGMLPISIDDITIDHYFGTYDGVVILTITNSRDFPPGTFGVHVWKAGEFYGLQWAYVEGFITEQKEIEIWSLFHELFPNIKFGVRPAVGN